MSCLFNSLGRILSMDTDKCRQSICNYLESGQPIIDGMKTEDILRLDRSNYISKMRQSSTWGGAIEIQAACNIWSKRIIVMNHRSGSNEPNIEFLPVNGKVDNTIYLSWTGGHYEPV